MDCSSDLPANLIVADSCTLGLDIATPLVRLTAFDGDAGRMPFTAQSHHRLLFAEERFEVRMVLPGGPAGAAPLVLDPGDALIAPAGMAAGLEWSGHLRGIGIFIDADGLQAFARTEMGLAIRGIGREGEVLHDTGIADAVRAVRDALANEGAGRRVVFEGLSRVFLAQLVERHGQRADPLDIAFGPDRMHVLRSYVDARLHLSPHVPDMARTMGMSATAFGRTLRRATGLTPMGYVRDRRIARARALLSGDAALGEIAVRCGYADQAHFTRSFKAATGMTPRAWRLARRGEVVADAAPGEGAASGGGRTGSGPAAGDGQSATFAV